MPRRHVELAWAAFAAANVAAMIAWESWETIPFHFIWVSLTLLYGFRVWSLGTTGLVLAAVCVVTGTVIAIDAHEGIQTWGELTEVPLMSAMFLAMVWHARRRQQAMQEVERLADERAEMVARQERFVLDVSHELRTPVTIARGHLEVLRDRRPEVEVALDELGRMERIVERLLRLAASERPDSVFPERIDTVSFVEDVFLRWAEVAPRVWRLGPLAAGEIRADREALREALDALLENAVKFTAEGDAIDLRSSARGGTLVIAVADTGRSIPEAALGRIFERFARADAARSRTEGGVGLGLAIVDAIARAHAGRCTVRSSSAETTFTLALPGFSEHGGPTREAAAASVQA